MAGPWFAVRKGGSDWEKLGDVWISDGGNDCQGTIETKVILETSENSVCAITNV